MGFLSTRIKEQKLQNTLIQLNITNNRIKNDTFISMFSTFLIYGNQALFLPFLTQSIDTHLLTHVEMRTETLPCELISKIVLQLKSYMTFLSSKFLEAVQQRFAISRLKTHRRRYSHALNLSLSLSQIT